MIFTATLLDYNLDDPEYDVVFEDVTHYEFLDNFLIVFKANGEHHAIQSANVTKFSLI